MRRGCSSVAKTLRADARSALIVLVAATEPEVRLVAAPRGAVEPLVHAPEAVQSTSVSRVGVVNDAVLQRERAHARSFARVRGDVGSGHGSEGARPLPGAFPRPLALVVVFEASRALLLLG